MNVKRRENMDEIIANIELNLFNNIINDDLKFINKFINSYSSYLKNIVNETDVHFEKNFDVIKVFKNWKENKECHVMAEFVIIMALNHALMQVCDFEDKWHELDFKSMLFNEHAEMFFSVDGTLVNSSTLIIIQSKAIKKKKKQSRKRYNRQNRGVGYSTFKWLQL